MLLNRIRRAADHQQLSPVLYVMPNYWSRLQETVMSRVIDFSHEKAFYIHCKRVWQESRPVFIMNEAQVPRRSDYFIQNEGRVAIAPAYLNDVLDRIQESSRHLLVGHTHPEGGQLRPSTADTQTCLDLAIVLQGMTGQRQLIEGIFDYKVSLENAYWRLHTGHQVEEIEIRQVDALPPITGFEYITNGSLMHRAHICAQPKVPLALCHLSNLPNPLLIQAEAFAGDLNDIVPLANLNDMMVRIISWSWNCGCSLRLKEGEVIRWGDLED